MGSRRSVLLLDALEGTSDKYPKAKSHLDGARNLYQLFIQDGLLTDELMAGALCLAHLEGTRRSGAFNEADLETFDERPNSAPWTCFSSGANPGSLLQWRRRWRRLAMMRCLFVRIGECEQMAFVPGTAKDRQARR